MLGYALLGVAQGFIFIPILPEVLDAIYFKNKITEGEDDDVDAVISDKASGLYGSFLSAGLIVAPILGSLVYETFADRLFTKTTDVFAIASLIWTLLFLVFNILIDMRLNKQKTSKNIVDRTSSERLKMGVSIRTESFVRDGAPNIDTEEAKDENIGQTFIIFKKTMNPNTTIDTSASNDG